MVISLRPRPEGEPPRRGDYLRMVTRFAIAMGVLLVVWIILLALGHPIVW